MKGLVKFLEDTNPIQAAGVLTAVELVGDRAAKLGLQEATYASYIALAFVLPNVLKDNPLGLTNAYWNAMTNVTGIVIGVYYGEKYTMQQLAGIALMGAGFLMLGGAFVVSE